jgi:DNA-binding NarL/FixJ family response regulator
MSEIKLFIVDDHPVFRQGLRDVLETDSRLQVVGEAATGEAAIDLTTAL